MRHLFLCKFGLLHSIVAVKPRDEIQVSIPIRHFLTHFVAGLTQFSHFEMALNSHASLRHTEASNFGDTVDEIFLRISFVTFKKRFLSIFSVSLCKKSQK